MGSKNAHALELILSKKDTDLIDAHLTIGSREARINFGKIVENAKNSSNQFVITEHGEPAAALIPISDLRILDWMQRQNIKEIVGSAAYRNLKWFEFRDMLEGDEDGHNNEVDVQKPVRKTA